MGSVQLLGSLVTIKLRPAGSGTYKDMTCQSDFTVKSTTPTSITYTNCGALTSVGVNSYSITANGVFNTNSDPSTQLSTNQLSAYQSTQTLLDILLEDPVTTSAGSVYLRQGQCYITDLTETGSAQEFIKFSITFSVNGGLTTGGA